MGTVKELKDLVQQAIDKGATTVEDVHQAIARMPLDAPLPCAWAERRVNLVQFTQMERGGHHSSWEVPEAFAADLRAFLQTVRALLPK